MAAWAGLGYYARARNLHACARAVVGGAAGFPATWRGCARCRGSAPIPRRRSAAIAFGVPAVPVDGNVERVVARLFAVERRCRRAKPTIARPPPAGRRSGSRARPADFAQALFDLGATICTPRARVRAVSLVADCAGAARGHRGGAAAQGRRKPLRPLRYGVHFWLRTRR